LSWDSTNNVPEFTPIPLSAASATPTASLEGAVFAPVGILELPPVDPICVFLTSQSVTGRVNLSVPITLPSVDTSIAYYTYNAPNGDASDFVDRALYAANTLTIFFTIDFQNLVSLVIAVDNAASTTGGSLTLNIEAPNLQTTLTQLVVQDDPGSGLPTASAPGHVDYSDNYVYQDGQASFRWQWGVGSGDGAVLSPLNIYGQNGGICFTFSIEQNTNITAWRFAYPESGQIQFQSVGLSDTPTVCIYDCLKYCFLFDNCGDCAVNSECEWCQDDQTCHQTSDTFTCSVIYSGNDCPCGDYNNSGCAVCGAHSYCKWCCNNGTGSCIDIGSSASCGNSACITNSSQCVRGSFVCDSCVCPFGFGGPTCNETYDCAGKLAGNATLDICGVCNGNGTSCLGCDGKPFGAHYDNCGVCGGNGTSCGHNCADLDCWSCFHDGIEYCYWCPNINECFNRVDLSACTVAAGNISDCSTSLTPGEIAGISAGAVAGIVIGALAIGGFITFGGKKGYDFYKKRKENITGAHSNPLYADQGRTGTNPLYS